MNCPEISFLDDLFCKLQPFWEISPIRLPSENLKHKKSNISRLLREKSAFMFLLSIHSLNSPAVWINDLRRSVGSLFPVAEPSKESLTMSAYLPKVCERVLITHPLLRGTGYRLVNNMGLREDKFIPDGGSCVFEENQALSGGLKGIKVGILLGSPTT